MGAGAGVGVGVGEWGESVYLSILEGTCTVLYCTQRSGVESKQASEHLFLAGKLFLCFFFLGSRGGTCSSSRRRKSALVLFISVFGGGVFGTAAAAGFYLALPLSFFPGRASLEEGRWKREREERKAV